MTPRPLETELWAKEIAGLERFELAFRGPAFSNLPGRRRGLAAGAGIDFADYRRYSPGDDVRTLDWALYARLRKLFARRFRADSELAVHLLVDVSRSMAYGRREKLAAVKRIARAVSYVGLSHLDPVGLSTFADRLLDSLPPRRDRRQLFEIHRRLEEAWPEGRTDFGRSCRQYGSRVRRPGLAIVMSDFLSVGGYAEGLEFLRYRGLDLTLIQVLAAEELDPSIDDAVELVDVEAPGLARVPADRRSVAVYRRNLSAFQSELSDFSMRRGVPLVRLDSSVSFAEMARALLEAGVWQGR